MSDLNQLIRQRASIKHKLSQFSNFIIQFQEDLSAVAPLADEYTEEFKLRYTSSKDLTQEYEKIQTEIEINCEQKDFEEQMADRDIFCAALSKTLSKAQVILGKLDVKEQLPYNTNRQEIKLPTINLPTYSGNLNDWLEYKDTFESLIHTNSSITNVQKFHYLRASLKGEALKVIQSIDFTTDNYKLAWTLLCQRYDNKKLLALKLVRNLYEAEEIIKESSASLRQLNDTIFKNLTSLGNVVNSDDHLDLILVYMITKKFDKTTFNEWEKFKGVSDLPKVDDLRDFLKRRADVLEAIELNYKSKRDAHVGKRAMVLTANGIRCNYCGQNHQIYKCQEFLGLSITNRVKKAKELNLCQNCLLTGHTSKNCKSGSCKKCNNKHNSLLHENLPQPSQQVALLSSVKNTPLLSTAVILVNDTKGIKHPCKALLDSGSTSNFISEKLFKKLGLEKVKQPISIVGINNVLSKVNFKCNLFFKSNCTNFSTAISCYIMSDMPETSGTFQFDIQSLDLPENITLADPTFNEPGEIDMLLGADIFWDLILADKIRLQRTQLILQNTVLGWIVAGSIPNENAHNHCLLVREPNFQFDLKNFWEIEEIAERSLSSDEQACENHFKANTTRNGDGKFIVRIPFKHSTNQLGDSKQLAIKRFTMLEKKFNFNQDLKRDYSQFVNEYRELKHMSLSINEIGSRSNYFLPHHPVIKNDSVTTKLRVVFDGSAITSTGISLNSLQFKGAPIQNDIFCILIRFREHRYVISADIEKMYRQILVHPEDRKFQQILWRDDSTKPLQTYILNTVTYGTASAPFLANRCLKQLAFDHKKEFPQASEVIERDFYVDDVLTGADCENQAIVLCKQLSSLLSSASFHLRKWNSNSNKILSSIQGEEVPKPFLLLGDSDISKTLGIQWNTKYDDLTFHVSKIPPRPITTKRSILSYISKLYDPLGLAGPSIVLTKILIQKLWLEKLGWDEDIPNDLYRHWVRIRDQLSLLDNLCVPRYVFLPDAVTIQLHGFCDASQNAYGACIYVRCVDRQNQVRANLLCSKTKVAPVKTLTIPRLELCSAVLLSRLMFNVSKALTKQADIYLWSDSQITLYWINTQPNILQTFVSNRVAEIQKLTKSDSWHYISSKENPADLTSRGAFPQDLLNSQLWWKGPGWLENLSIDLTPFVQPSFEIPELKGRTANLVATIPFNIFNKYSDLNKLKRIIALCLRFSSNCKLSKYERSIGSLTSKELSNAMLQLVKISQNESFGDEIHLLSQNKNLKVKHKLLGLAPFIDDNGLLRVGGRLRRADLPYDSKHPILLCGKHALTQLIMSEEHKKLLHPGPQLLLASVRQNYWPTSGLQVAKHIVKTCIQCFKQKPNSIYPFMGDLPKERISISYPFSITGVDYAGPFLIKDRKGRGCRLTKGYICLFVCFSTKALHFELASDLTSECFLAALRRFVSRRGKPNKIYSDNATNFVGTNNLLSSITTEMTISNFCTSEAIEWNFIPPNSPHFGGIWESGVKSCKHHLTRVVGETKFTYEEFYTLIVQIEAILNSRPLYPLSSDPNDLDPLTPSHFLIGRSTTAVPEQNLEKERPTALSRLQLIQQLKQHFWRRWSKEYLFHLQQRTKWAQKMTSISDGTLALIRNDNIPPGQWQLGRVVELHPGEDGVVRVVTLKTKGGTLKRAVTRICPLPTQE